MPAASDEKRCTYVYRDTPKAREAGKVGQRCGAPKVNGTDRCKFHGGSSPGRIQNAQRARILAEVEAEVPGFTDMWPETHHLLDPFSMMLWEIRRSGARIEWFDRKLSELEDEKAIWWGKSKEERIGASEFTGVNKTYEAREHVLVKMQNEERERFKKLRDSWQNDRFEAARVAGMGAFGAAARQMIAMLCAEFGIDLSNPEVQARVQHALEGLPDPVPLLSSPKSLDKAPR